MSCPSMSELYRERLDALHAFARESLSSVPDISFAHAAHDFHEEGDVPYQAHDLQIVHQGRLIATLQPIGANIIGAYGRVDLVGRLDAEVLLYLVPGQPRTDGEPRTGLGERPECDATPKPQLFRGVTHAGWYWIDMTRPGRARSVDNQLFLDLLESVSNAQVLADEAI